LLCLSNGNADGLGTKREEELQKCCKFLSNCIGLFFDLVEIEKTTCLNHEKLQDGFKQIWDLDLIADIVFNYIKENKIDGILTFDKNGVSGHPNHKAVHQGVM